MVNLFKKRKEIEIYAPAKGKLCDIVNVKDAMFAQKLLGDGCAVHPQDGMICSPCDGVITMIANTAHAFGITTKQGAELLVHVGLDTVNLQGKGFRTLASVHDKVKANDPILQIDMKFMKEQNIDLTMPIVLTNGEAYEMQKVLQEGDVTTSTMIMKITKK